MHDYATENEIYITLIRKTHMISAASIIVEGAKVKAKRAS